MQTSLFIGGKFVESVCGETIPVLSPHTGGPIAEVASAGMPDVDRAVAAAANAFETWAARAASERGLLLGRLAEAVELNGEELARLESQDTGHPIRDSTRLDVPRTAATLRYFAGMADKLEGSVIPVDAGFFNYVLREPIGVVGQIVPWNFPLMFCAWKLGPALAAGNSVVLKPSELTPLTSLRLAELIAEVGFPEGVVNIIPGLGATAGAAMARHPGIAKISFTGSTAVGRKMASASAGTLKQLQLELGGKGANIVFSDADLSAAVKGSAFASFHNQGQACIAGSRILLEEAISEEFLSLFVPLAASIRLGDPMDAATEMGPLTSAGHRDRVVGYLSSIENQTSEVLIGGGPPERPDLEGGYYFSPTIVRVEPNSPIWRDEIFGPVVAVTTFRDEAEALRIANESEYGLGGGLWTRDLTRAHRVARGLRAGVVWINCYKKVGPGSPFGGVGQSGYGREMGFDAMHEYTQARSVWVNLGGEQPNWYGGNPY